MAETDRISAVICVKNGAATIEQLLRSLKRCNLKEIVIVDGMSDDGTREICRRFTDIVLSDEGKGLSCARQIGAEAASGELIAFIDADTSIPSKDIFPKMLNEMRNNRWVSINPRIVDPRANKSIWEDAQDRYYRSIFNSPGEKKFLIGMFFIIRKDILLRYPFDPDFTFGSEDTDFFFRLRMNGYRFGVSREVIHHFHRSSLKEFARQKIEYGVGEMRFLMKHRQYGNLTTPFYILVTGIFRNFFRPSHIIFYLFWTIFLEIGMIKGMLKLGTGSRGN